MNEEWMRLNSRILHILTGTAYSCGYWGYDSRVLRIWLTGTAYPHQYWGYDSWVLMIWLMGTAYPHQYWGYDSQVLHTLTGTEDMTHGYWWYDSQVMHILTGTAYSLYRVAMRYAIQTFKLHLLGKERTIFLGFNFAFFFLKILFDILL